MAEHDAGSLSFLTEGLRIETRGLRTIGHPELAIQAVNVAQLSAARALLTTLAARVMLGSGFVAGDELLELGVRCRLEVATLELWEEDGSGFSRGCPQLLSLLSLRES
jgi:hypothetical protein